MGPDLSGLRQGWDASELTVVSTFLFQSVDSIDISTIR